MKKCRGLQDYVNGYNYFYNNYRITYYMSNIEPLLNAVDTLVDLIREYEDCPKDDREELWDTINSQADYVSGIIVGARMINKTNLLITKPKAPVNIDRTISTDTYLGSVGQITYTDHGYTKSD